MTNEIYNSSSNKYKRLADGSWGAWIDTGYGRNKVAKPVPGELALIQTKGGESHKRVIAGIAVNYASGCIVRLVADAVVTANAQARFAAAKIEREVVQVGPGLTETVYAVASRDSGMCRKCGSYCYGDCEAN